MFTRTPNASDRDIGRWCHDLQIPLSQGLHHIGQMRAKRTILQATSLPTPSSSASPEVRSREIPGTERVEQETRRVSAASVDAKVSEGNSFSPSLPPCPWLDELAARSMPADHLETVRCKDLGIFRSRATHRSDPIDHHSDSVPTSLEELDDSLAEFRAALARLRGNRPGNV